MIKVPFNTTVKGEQNQQMICDFTEFRTNTNKRTYDFLMKIVGVKARLYLIGFKFPAKHAGCHFTLISDVTPSTPIYLFS